MSNKYDFDFIIIGSGPAGSSIAFSLAANKKRVCLAEERSFGGSDLCTRDIPYLVGQSFAHNFYNLSESPEMGGQKLHFNFPTIASHQLAVTNLLGANDTAPYEKAGITCLQGHAHFLNNHTVAIGDQQYTSKDFIIATGSTLSTGDIIGLDSIKYLTPDMVMRLRRQPRFIFIIGGGPTGCEIAEYFTKLGTKVIIMEKESSLLPKEDPEVGATLRDYFVNELGIMVVTNSKVLAIEKDSTAKRVVFKSDLQDKSVRVDCIALATGSRPNTDCGLENANIQTNKSGAIATNKFFQTTTKNIYAVGDCLGGNHSSTERARHEAFVLADNILHHSKGITNYHGFVRTVNTYPAVACVGPTEAHLKRHHAKYKTSTIYLKDIPASTIESLDYGFVKIIVNSRTKQVLGASIIAPDAALMAQELAIAIRHHLTALELASTPHIANSYSYAIKLAAKQLV